jgi:hypothetical protein
MSSILRDSVSHYLTEVDPILAKEEMPLRYRALQSALTYVEDMVQEVRGGTLDAPIGQPWFDAIHYEALRWYHERYGDAMRVDTEGNARGVTLIGGAPIAFSFPLTVARPGSQPLTIRLWFPDNLREDEDPITFIDGDIGLHTFPESAREQLRREIVDTVGQIRQLNRGLRFAELSSTAQALVSRVMWSLRHAAESISANSAERLGLAVWELNLATELSIKVFLTQRGVKFPKIHDVNELYRLAVAAGLPAVEAGKLNQFPTVPTVIKYRYGEEPSPSLTDVISLYRAVLMVTAHCAANCTHGIWIAPDGWIEVRTIGSLARGD